MRGLAGRSRTCSRDWGRPAHMDWRQQAVTTAWAMREGHGRHWSTWNTANRNAGR
jgi:hypothetical protein